MEKPPQKPPDGGGALTGFTHSQSIIGSGNVLLPNPTVNKTAQKKSEIPAKAINTTIARTFGKQDYHQLNCLRKDIIHKVQTGLPNEIQQMVICNIPFFEAVSVVRHCVDQGDSTWFFLLLQHWRCKIFTNQHLRHAIWGISEFLGRKTTVDRPRIEDLASVHLGLPPGNITHEKVIKFLARISDKTVKNAATSTFNKNYSTRQFRSMQQLIHSSTTSVGHQVNQQNLLLGSADDISNIQTEVRSIITNLESAMCEDDSRLLGSTCQSCLEPKIGKASFTPVLCPKCKSTFEKLPGFSLRWLREEYGIVVWDHTICEVWMQRDITFWNSGKREVSIITANRLCQLQYHTTLDKHMENCSNGRVSSSQMDSAKVLYFDKCRILSFTRAAVKTVFDVYTRHIDLTLFDLPPVALCGCPKLYRHTNLRDFSKFKCLFDAVQQPPPPHHPEQYRQYQSQPQWYSFDISYQAALILHRRIELNEKKITVLRAIRVFRIKIPNPLLPRLARIHDKGTNTVSLTTNTMSLRFANIVCKRIYQCEWAHVENQSQVTLYNNLKRFITRTAIICRALGQFHPALSRLFKDLIYTVYSADNLDKDERTQFALDHIDHILETKLLPSVLPGHPSWKTLYAVNDDWADDQVKIFWEHWDVNTSWATDLCRLFESSKTVILKLPISCLEVTADNWMRMTPLKTLSSVGRGKVYIDVYESQNAIDREGRVRVVGL